jgi:hypothetical protein
MHGTIDLTGIIQMKSEVNSRKNKVNKTQYIYIVH